MSRTNGYVDICNAFFIILPYPTMSRTSEDFGIVVPYSINVYRVSVYTITAATLPFSLNLSQ